MINPTEINKTDLSKYTRSELEKAFVEVSVQKEIAEQKLKWYEEQYKLSLQRRFGRKSEKYIQGQITIDMLFNEAEDERQPFVAEPVIAPEENETPETDVVTRKKKQKGKRERDLSKLPKQVVIHTLSEEERICPQCDGTMHKIRDEVRHELEVVPAQVIVKETRQEIYGCRDCEENETSVPIIMAPAPKPVIKGSLASPSLIADIINKKYVLATPLYRQEQEYQRLGLSISRQNMSNWIIKVASDWLKLIYMLMKVLLVLYDVLQADETELEVLNEPGRKASTKSYMWMYRTGNGHHPIVLFEYQCSRAGDNAKKFLKGFKGFLQTDAFEGYEKLIKESAAGPPMEVTLVGCFAHARRYFVDALKAVPDKDSILHTSAFKAVEMLRGMFELEHTFEGLTYEKRYQERLLKLKPLLEIYFEWIEKEHELTLPKCSYSKAVQYSFNQKDKLMNILLDGRLELTNNRSERTIKPFVIGRKNWLFSNTPGGADSSAIVYSIVETAKENNLVPYEYIKFLLETLPNLDKLTPEVLNDLLPWSKNLPERCYSKKD